MRCIFQGFSSALENVAFGRSRFERLTMIPMSWEGGSESFLDERSRSWGFNFCGGQPT